MADLRISELNTLAGQNLAAGDFVAVADTSASETKKITVTDLFGNSATLIADATIPGAKILFSANTVNGSALVDGSVTGTQIAEDAVAGSNLADNSSAVLAVSLPESGDFVGQVAVETTGDIAYIWNGSLWETFKASGSINTIVGGSAGVVNVTVTTVGDTATLNTTLDDTTAAGQFLAGPAADAGAVGYRIIEGSDLPTAGTGSKGGITVNGEGLRLDGDQLEVDNDVTESGDYHVVTYTSKGLISAGRLITSADVPAATAAAKGAVLPGTGLSVDGTGTLNHSNSTTPGTYPRVTVDSEGHVSEGSNLDATDIPNLDASKITTGQFGTAVIQDNAITGAKLANNSVTKIGETIPTPAEFDYNGQLFFNPVQRAFYVFDGNVAFPVGVSYGQIVFAGTYDANAAEIATVTSAGSAIGLAAGTGLPTPDSTNNSYYFIVETGGTPSGDPNAPNKLLAPPDMLVSNGSSWNEIDVSSTVAAEIASNITVTPAGNITSINVQSAIEELDDEKVAKAGDTMSGDLTLGVGADLIFEGGTDDAYETTLTVTDPTADRTITLPNATGTVVLSGAIVNADINASAAIADSKLATLSTANKVSLAAVDIDGATDIGAPLADADLIPVDDGGAGTNRKAAATRVPVYVFSKISGDVTVNSSGVAAIEGGVIVDADVNGSAAIAGTKISPNFGSQAIATTGSLTSAGGTFTSNITLNAQSDLRFADSDSSNWIAFQAPATIASNVTWTLPNADGTSGQLLSTNGSGTLSWTDPVTPGVSLGVALALS